jgi:hypothetical protein
MITIRSLPHVEMINNAEDEDADADVVEGLVVVQTVIPASASVPNTGTFTGANPNSSAITDTVCAMPNGRHDSCALTTFCPRLNIRHE